MSVQPVTDSSSGPGPGPGRSGPAGRSPRAPDRGPAPERGMRGRRPGEAGGPTRRAATEAETASSGDVHGSAERLPRTAPPGVDPELWSLLSKDERAYLSGFRSAGSLTYGPRSAGDGAAAAARGVRVDVRA